MAGAETLLPLALMLVRDEHLTLERLFALLARNPARVLGLDTGTLEVGKPADLMLFDGPAPWQIVGEAFKAEAGNTPFDGLPVQGRVLRLWKGGREVR
jgi:dihydroorotase